MKVSNEANSLKRMQDIEELPEPATCSIGGL